MKISVGLEEATEVYKLLEDMNQFFHEPRNYEGNKVYEFMHNGNYERIRRAYYDIVSSWLTGEAKEELWK